MADDELDSIRAAQAGLEASRRVLADAVKAARAADHTWAEIGELLGISRQAAFKRFGSPRDPRTGNVMAQRSSRGVIDRATEAFQLLNAGNIDALQALMAPGIAGQLTRELLTDTWASVVGETGPLVDVADPVVTMSDGTPLSDDDQVLGPVVGQLTLVCEAGEWTGRVTVDDSGRVIGLLILPPGGP